MESGVPSGGGIQLGLGVVSFGLKENERMVNRLIEGKKITKLTHVSSSAGKANREKCNVAIAQINDMIGVLNDVKVTSEDELSDLQKHAKVIKALNKDVKGVNDEIEKNKKNSFGYKFLACFGRAEELTPLTPLESQKLDNVVAAKRMELFKAKLSALRSAGVELGIGSELGKNELVVDHSLSDGKRRIYMIESAADGYKFTTKVIEKTGKPAGNQDAKRYECKTVKDVLDGTGLQNALREVEQQKADETKARELLANALTGKLSDLRLKDLTSKTTPTADKVTVSYTDSEGRNQLRDILITPTGFKIAQTASECKTVKEVLEHAGFNAALNAQVEALEKKKAAEAEETARKAEETTRKLAEAQRVEEEKVQAEAEKKAAEETKAREQRAGEQKPANVEQKTAAQEVMEKLDVLDVVLKDNGVKAVRRSPTNYGYLISAKYNDINGKEQALDIRIASDGYTIGTSTYNDVSKVLQHLELPAAMGEAKSKIAEEVEKKKAEELATQLAEAQRVEEEKKQAEATKARGEHATNLSEKLVRLQSKLNDFKINVSDDNKSATITYTDVDSSEKELIIGITPTGYTFGEVECRTVDDVLGTTKLNEAVQAKQAADDQAKLGSVEEKLVSKVRQEEIDSIYSQLQQEEAASREEAEKAKELEEKAQAAALQEAAEAQATRGKLVDKLVDKLGQLGLADVETIVADDKGKVTVTYKELGGNKQSVEIPITTTGYKVGDVEYNVDDVFKYTGLSKASQAQKAAAEAAVAAKKLEAERVIKEPAKKAEEPVKKAVEATQKESPFDALLERIPSETPIIDGSKAQEIWEFLSSNRVRDVGKAFILHKALDGGLDAYRLSGVSDTPEKFRISLPKPTDPKKTGELSFLRERAKTPSTKTYEEFFSGYTNLGTVFKEQQEIGRISQDLIREAKKSGEDKANPSSLYSLTKQLKKDRKLVAPKEKQGDQINGFLQAKGIKGNVSKKVGAYLELIREYDRSDSEKKWSDSEHAVLAMLRDVLSGTETAQTSAQALQQVLNPSKGRTLLDQIVNNLEQDKIMHRNDKIRRIALAFAIQEAAAPKAAKGNVAERVAQVEQQSVDATLRGSGLIEAREAAEKAQVANEQEIAKAAEESAKKAAETAEAARKVTDNSDKLTAMLLNSDLKVLEIKVSSEGAEKVLVTYKGSDGAENEWHVQVTDKGYEVNRGGSGDKTACLSADDVLRTTGLGAAVDEVNRKIAEEAERQKTEELSKQQAETRRVEEEKAQADAAKKAAEELVKRNELANKLVSRLEQLGLAGLKTTIAEDTEKVTVTYKDLSKKELSVEISVTTTGYKVGDDEYNVENVLARTGFTDAAKAKKKASEKALQRIPKGTHCIERGEAEEIKEFLLNQHDKCYILNRDEEDNLDVYQYFENTITKYSIHLPDPTKSKKESHLSFRSGEALVTGEWGVKLKDYQDMGEQFNKDKKLKNLNPLTQALNELKLDGLGVTSEEGRITVTYKDVTNKDHTWRITADARGQYTVEEDGVQSKQYQSVEEVLNQTELRGAKDVADAARVEKAGKEAEAKRLLVSSTQEALQPFMKSKNVQEFREAVNLVMDQATPPKFDVKSEVCDLVVIDEGQQPKVKLFTRSPSGEISEKEFVISEDGKIDNKDVKQFASELKNKLLLRHEMIKTVCGKIQQAGAWDEDGKKLEELTKDFGSGRNFYGVRYIPDTTGTGPGKLSADYVDADGQVKSRHEIQLTLGNLRSIQELEEGELLKDIALLPQEQQQGEKWVTVDKVISLRKDHKDDLQAFSQWMSSAIDCKEEDIENFLAYHQEELSFVLKKTAEFAAAVYEFRQGKVEKLDVSPFPTMTGFTSSWFKENHRVAIRYKDRQPDYWPFANIVSLDQWTNVSQKCAAFVHQQVTAEAAETPLPDDKDVSMQVQTLIQETESKIGEKTSPIKDETTSLSTVKRCSTFEGGKKRQKEENKKDNSKVTSFFKQMDGTGIEKFEKLYQAMISNDSKIEACQPMRRLLACVLHGNTKMEKKKAALLLCNCMDVKWEALKETIARAELENDTHDVAGREKAVALAIVIAEAAAHPGQIRNAPK